MLLSGDEFLNTQGGNNNVYCQDNPTSWLDWNGLAERPDVFAFFKKMIAFRHAHPVLRRNDYYAGYNVTGYPTLSFHGLVPWELDTDHAFHSFGFLYTEPASEYGTEGDAYIYCAVNAFWEERTFGLPVIPAGNRWELVVYTGDPKSGEKDPELLEKGTDSVTLMPRSLMLLIGMKSVIK